MTESDDKNLNQAGARPGREMKKVREQAGITLSYIAERTLISEARLSALENDDYDNVGSVAYITGYARAYAKVVGFNPTAHVEALEQAVGFQREQVVAPDVDYKPLPRRKVLPPLTTITGAILGVIILGLAAGYWLSAQPDRSPARAQPKPAGAQSASLNPALATPAAEAGDSNNELSNPAVSVPMTVLNRGQLPVPEPSTQGFSPEPTGSDVALGAQAQEQRELDKNPEMENEHIQQAGRLSELVIEFNEECWLRVVDAEGKRLIENVRQAGDTLTLSGPAPFNIRLGNARAVDIELDGDAVPVRPRPGQRTLELSVGG